MTTPENNPFASPILSLRLTARDYVTGGGPSETAPDIVLWGQPGYNPNPYCSFLRMEFEESAFMPFPAGRIVVQDKADIASLIEKYSYKYIYCELIDGKKYLWDIKSTFYPNNSVSDFDKTFFEIQFTNRFYFEAQRRPPTLGMDKALQFPRVGKVRNLMNLMLADVKTEIGTPSTPPINRNISTADPDNYVLFRARNIDHEGKEVWNDTFMNLLNYLFEYSTVAGSPRFMFWSAMDNSLYYKFFDIERDLASGFSRKLGTGDPRFIKSFAIYNVATPTTTIDDQVYYKIYALSGQYKARNERQTYYNRYTPKFLHQGVTGMTAAREALGSMFLQRDDQFIAEKFTSYPTGSGATGAMFLIEDSTPWGYPPTDAQTSKNLQDSLETTEFLARRPSLDDGDWWNTEFTDSVYMFQTQFDITPLHPNLPGGQGFSGNFASWDDCNLNRVLYCSRSPMPSNEVDERAEVAQQQEYLNVLKYVLCCIGRQVPEPDWFFALLTGYERIYEDGEYGPWRYYWVKIDPTVLPDGFSFFDDEGYANLYGNLEVEGVAIHLNEVFNDAPDIPDIDCYLRGRGLTFQPSGTGDSNSGHWSAITAGSGALSWVPYNPMTGGLDTSLYSVSNYLGPGFDKRNITASPGFPYRPIGFLPLASSTSPGGTAGYNVVPPKGVCRQIVKMYVYTDPAGNKMHYFDSPTNVVDGACPS